MQPILPASCFLQKKCPWDSSGQVLTNARTIIHSLLFEPRVAISQTYMLRYVRRDLNSFKPGGGMEGLKICHTMDMSQYNCICTHKGWYVTSFTGNLFKLHMSDSVVVNCPGMHNSWCTNAYIFFMLWGWHTCIIAFIQCMMQIAMNLKNYLHCFWIRHANPDSLLFKILKDQDGKALQKMTAKI